MPAPRTLAEVDLSAITTALTAAKAPGRGTASTAGGGRERLTDWSNDSQSRVRSSRRLGREPLLCNNGLVEISGKRLRVSELFRQLQDSDLKRRPCPPYGVTPSR